VLHLLIVLSVLSLAVALERGVHLARHSTDALRLRLGLDERLRVRDLAGARALLDGDRSHVAAIMKVGLDNLERGAAATEEMLQAATGAQKLVMERGLTFLGTLGSNAPFVGLFGTVLGIIRAFRDLSANTQAGSEAVMAGIAEALVATAVGLLVALPAVALFNTFQKLIRAQLSRAESVSHVLLAFAKAERTGE
jgi:biopolymer transport protein ExbB